MFVSAESNDGIAHTVRMYSDISGGEHSICPKQTGELILLYSEFLLGAPGANVSWQSYDDGINIILSEKLIQPVPFGEVADHALDSVEYYCYKRVSIMFIRRIHLTDFHV